MIAFADPPLEMIYIEIIRTTNEILFSKVRTQTILTSAYESTYKPKIIPNTKFWQIHDTDSPKIWICTLRENFDYLLHCWYALKMYAALTEEEL